MERLRAVGRVIATMYQEGGLMDHAWQNLFEALFDAGLLAGEEAE